MTLEEMIGQFTAYTEYPNQDTFVISNQECKDILKYLKQVPKTGHWVKHDTSHGMYYYDCSRCGCVAPCTETADSFLWKLSNYCPDCGAKMTESEE